MRAPVPPGRPVVVKVGSSSLVDANGRLDEAGLQAVAAEVAALWDEGRPAVLVSSGAVAAGLPALGMDKRPGDMPGLQVAAAVGQSRLMQRYTAELGERGLVAGQVLLTKDILANRSQYLTARQALDRMLAEGVVPIVNENDTVVVDELRLGDNDRLAAIVSHLVGAGMLVILTDTAGIYSADPRFDEEAELLGAVRHTDRILDEVTRGRSGPLGSGGVATKVAAARMAAWSGIPTVIAAAREPAATRRAVAGEEIGTWVAPQPSGLSARKLWIAFGQPAEGEVAVDDGAAAALVAEGRSLLAVGVTGVAGEFAAGSAVEVVGPDGVLIGKGLVALDAGRIAATMGEHSSVAGGEVIHRDDLVVLAGYSAGS